MNNRAVTEHSITLIEQFSDLEKGMVVAVHRHFVGGNSFVWGGTIRTVRQREADVLDENGVLVGRLLESDFTPKHGSTKVYLLAKPKESRPANQIRRFDQLKDGMLVVVHDSDIWGGTVLTGPDPSRVNLLDKAGRSRGILDKHNFHRREVTLLNGTLPPERCGWRGFAMTDSGAAEGCVLDAGHEGKHKFTEPPTRCTHVLNGAEDSRRCVREWGHSGVHHYGPKPALCGHANPDYEEEGMVCALPAGHDRVELEDDPSVLMDHTNGEGAYWNEPRAYGPAPPAVPTPEGETISDTRIRIEAGRMASSIKHGTIGTLLSHARDCEEYLRGES